MKNRIVLGVFVFLVLFLICFLPIFAYYSFLSDEANIALENLKEKYRAKEIILEKEKGVVWAVILPRNDGVETSEVKEEIEGHLYTITEIIVMNAQAWTRIVWGPAAEIYPYDIPRVCFVFDGGELRGIEGFKFNWFGPSVIPAIGNGYYDKDGIYVPTDIISPEINPGDDYTYHQITLPPDPTNIPPGITFPSIGVYVLYVLDDDL